MPDRPAHIDISDLITQTEASKLRGTTRAAIHDLVERKRLGSVRIGDKTFVSRREVLAFTALRQPAKKKGTSK
jgi:hypothetical protein